MNNTFNQKNEERNPQVAQAGTGASKANASQPQQQGKFSQQHDADKAKTATPADKRTSESHKTEPHKKDGGKAC